MPPIPGSQAGPTEEFWDRAAVLVKGRMWYFSFGGHPWWKSLCALGGHIWLVSAFCLRRNSLCSRRGRNRQREKDWRPKLLHQVMMKSQKRNATPSWAERRMNHVMATETNVDPCSWHIVESIPDWALSIKVWMPGGDAFELCQRSWKHGRLLGGRDIPLFVFGLMVVFRSFSAGD